MLRLAVGAILVFSLALPVAAEGAGRRTKERPQRFNVVCTVSHLIGDERYVGSNHDPIPERRQLEFAVDLQTQQFQDRGDGYASKVNAIAEVNDRDVYLERLGSYFLGFRRRDLFMVETFIGPEDDVRVMAGPCRLRPFTPFVKLGPL